MANVMPDVRQYTPTVDVLAKVSLVGKAWRGCVQHRLKKNSDFGQQPNLIGWW